MKSTLTFIPVVLFISTLFLPSTFAEDYMRWELPEGATMRLGKGTIHNTIEKPIYQFSRDSSQLAVFTSIGIWIYDTQTGKEIRLLTAHHAGQFDDDTALSPDGKLFARSRDSWEHHEIQLGDTHTGKIKTTLEGHTKRVTSVAFSPDGKILASGDHAGVIRLWNVSTGEHRQIRTPHKSVNVVAFSPDGRTIMGRHDKDFRLWNIETGQFKIRLEDTKRFENITFSPTGELLVGANNSEIRLWNAQTGKIQTRFGDPSWYELLAFSPDGKTLAYANGNNYTVQLRDPYTGELKNTFSGDPEYINMTEISDGVPKLVDYATKRAESIAFSPDGCTLAVSSSGEIRLWDIDSGIHKMTLREQGLLYRLMFSPDGRTLVAKSSPSQTEIAVHLWNIDPTDVRKSKLRCLLSGHKVGVNSIAFSPDGKSLASGHRHQNIRLWDLETGRLKVLFKEHPFSLRVQSIAFAPDGKTLASLSISIQSSDSEAEILLWDAATGKYITTFQGHGKALGNGFSPHSSSIAFSPDGKTLVSGGLDGTIRLWNPKIAAGNSFFQRLWRHFSHPNKATLRGHRHHVYSVALSPDGRILASGSADKTVSLWDLRRRKLKGTLTKHPAEVKCVTFSPDGQTLASGDETGGIYLWKPNATDPKATLLKEPHSNSVINALAFSPDGATLASGGSIHRPGGNWTGGILLWNMDTRQLQKTLIGHKSWVNSVAFSPDGHTLASGSADGTVLIWELEP